MIDALLRKIIAQRVNNNFIDETPTAETCWRSIILLWKNTASYKFELGKALLELNFSKKNTELFFTQLLNSLSKFLLMGILLIESSDFDIAKIIIYDHTAIPKSHIQIQNKNPNFSFQKVFDN